MAQAAELQQWCNHYFFEAALHGCGTGPVSLFYVITTVFQLYQGGDMMYEMRRRKSETTLLPIQGIFNLPHRIA